MPKLSSFPAGGPIQLADLLAGVQNSGNVKFSGADLVALIKTITDPLKERIADLENGTTPPTGNASLNGFPLYLNGFAVSFN